MNPEGRRFRPPPVEPDWTAELEQTLRLTIYLPNNLGIVSRGNKLTMRASHKTELAHKLEQLIEVLQSNLDTLKR